jgi:hypothetical protein
MPPEVPSSPWKRRFDAARDVLAARNALGITTLEGGTGGGTSGAEYVFSTNTSAPPSSGQIRFNNATPAAVTVIWVHNVTNAGTDIKRILEGIPVGAKLIIQDKDNSANYADYTVTALVDGGTYWQFSVTFVVGAGTIANQQRVIFAWQTGAAGGPWTVYTPTLAAGSGILTTAAATGRFIQTGKTVNFSIRITITTNGTASTYLTATLPVAAFAASQVLSGYHETNTEVMSAVILSSAPSVVRIKNSAGEYPGANGAAFVISGAYEVA